MYEFHETPDRKPKTDSVLKALACSVAVIAVLSARPFVSQQFEESESSRIQNWATTERYRVETECELENLQRETQQDDWGVSHTTGIEQ